MSKRHTRFVCQECGAVQPKWTGRCPDCGEWNTFVETMVESESRSPPSVGSDTLLRNPPRKLGEVQADELARIPVPMAAFSRVLGGGIVPGSLVLIGGDPGIGKSTLLLQVSAQLIDRARASSLRRFDIRRISPPIRQAVPWPGLPMPGSR